MVKMLSIYHVFNATASLDNSTCSMDVKNTSGIMCNC